MQVSSVSFKGFDKDYDYGKFSKEIHNSIGAIKSARTDLFGDNSTDKYVDEKSNKKNVLGIAGSVAFIAGTSYLLTKKGFDGLTKLKDKIAALPASENKVAQNIFNNKAVKGVLANLNSVKNKALKVATNAKETVLSKLPEKVKSNKLTNFYNDLALKTSTKVGLVGAAAGTVAASRVDDNENGCADMFEKGISVLDSVANKAGKIIKVAEALS